MIYVIEHAKDGRSREVTPEVWDRMVSRGDARAWRIKSRKGTVPAEIEKAFKKKATKKQTEDQDTASEETSTE